MLVGALAATARAQEEVSVEVRLETPGVVERMEVGEAGRSSWENHHHQKSLHLTFGGGVRVFGPEGHGALLEVTKLYDPDIDGVFSESLHTEVPMLVAQLGYAYRHRVPRPGGRAIAITPQASLSVGRARQRADSAGLLGARIGLDVDFHFRSAFIGWGLRYGVVGYLQGSLDLDASHLFGFSLMPRFGFVLGRRVTSPRAPPSARQRSSPLSIELRLDPLGAAFRWSSGQPDPEIPTDFRAAHWLGGAGFRLFGAGTGHGALFDVAKATTFGANGATSDDPEVTIDLVLAHIGYAWRWLRRFGHQGAVSVTPHVGLAFGVTSCRYYASRCRPNTHGTNGLIGVRVGADVDLHFRRFFFGWGVRYEVLQHLEYGELDHSQVLAFDILPHMGFDFGARVTAPPEGEATR